MVLVTQNFCISRKLVCFHRIESNMNCAIPMTMYWFIWHVNVFDSSTSYVTQSNFSWFSTIFTPIFQFFFDESTKCPTEYNLISIIGVLPSSIFVDYRLINCSSIVCFAMAATCYVCCMLFESNATIECWLRCDGGKTDVSHRSISEWQLRYVCWFFYSNTNANASIHTPNEQMNIIYVDEIAWLWRIHFGNIFWKSYFSVTSVVIALRLDRKTPYIRSIVSDGLVSCLW